MFPIRRLVTVLSILALAAVACTGGNDDNDTTPQPTDEVDAVEQVAAFQLVGTIERAFVDIDLPVEIPDDDEQAPGPTTSPDASPVGEEADLPGVLRIETEDVSDDLRQECGVADGEDVRVYWTQATRFTSDDGIAAAEIGLDPAAFEDDLEGRVAGISGRVYLEGDDTSDLDTPEPDETDAPTEEPDLTNGSPFAVGSPGAVSAAAGECVLVADQVGFEQDQPEPTQRPVFRPRPTAAPTPTPEETDEPTAEPTEEPDETTAPSATATVEQQ